jgi:opacity protein-like surface antigen
MLSQSFRRVLALTLLVTGAAVAIGRADAQAFPTVQRGAEFAPFAQATLVNPDWGQTHNLGFTAGFDYTRFIPALVQPSLEFRVTHANGRTVNQTTYLGGFKLQTTIHNLHPYAVVLAGKGIVTFNYFYNGGLKGDDSAVYAYGGGLEFHPATSWKVRAEYTQQHWNLDPNTLTPSAIGIGVAYTVPFHNRGGIR